MHSAHHFMPDKDCKQASGGVEAAVTRTPGWQLRQPHPPAQTSQRDAPARFARSACCQSPRSTPQPRCALKMHDRRQALGHRARPALCAPRAPKTALPAEQGRPSHCFLGKHIAPPRRHCSKPGGATGWRFRYNYRAQTASTQRPTCASAFRQRLRSLRCAHCTGAARVQLCVQLEGAAQTSSSSSCFAQSPRCANQQQLIQQINELPDGPFTGPH